MTRRRRERVLCTYSCSGAASSNYPLISIHTQVLLLQRRQEQKRSVQTRGTQVFEILLYRMRIELERYRSFDMLSHVLLELCGQKFKNKA